MQYEVEFRPKALRDLKRLSTEMSRQIEKKLDVLSDNLSGDVKRLVNYSPGYRLRVGDWRVLFEIEGSTIIIHRIVHRSEAYE